MHLKVFLKLKKTLKTLSFGQIYKKKQKTPKNPPQKKTKKTHWAGFFQLCLHGDDAAFLDDVAAQAAQLGLALLAVMMSQAKS
jgi:hypothetical protein